VPIKAYAAVSTTAVSHFHQLHAGCGQRIQYAKHCACHGAVAAEAIVRGYEYAPDRPARDKALVLDQFPPFNAESSDGLLDQITSHEPRPPRQMDDATPKELERICLKALSKRATDRYTTARDMAEDLRHWLAAGGPRELPMPVEPEFPPALSDGKAVFLSYASQDKETAFHLCRLIEERGVSCWIAPRDVTPGADYAEAILRAIEGTGTTILLLTAHANASIHVMHEVERATSKRKRVIPVRLEDVQPGPAMELHLGAAHWLDAWSLSPEQMAERLVVAVRGETTTPAPPTTPTSDLASKIVPKGLRSFDASDADFFLELLPGPRNRDGLPGSIRFWKARIETMEADDTFSVGVIYGPSGCGKSSLLKAGLLPRIPDHIIAVYIEATGEETEARLLKGLGRLEFSTSVTDVPSGPFSVTVSR
jgi:hypothetical protein